MSHISKDDLARWRRGGTTGDSVLAIGRHLAECRRCAELAAGEIRLRESTRALNDQIALDEHPDVESELFAHAGHTLPPESRARIDAHLTECARCREDLADLRELNRSPSHRSRGWILALAASIAMVIAATALFRPDRTVETPPAAAPARAVRSTAPVSAPQPPDARADWNDVVESLRGGAPLGTPDVLSAIRRKPDVLRGDTTPGSERLEPTGVVLMNPQPQFTWTAPDGALSTVTIFEGDREVARSASLPGRVWTPSRALARSVTYTWQVDVEINDDTHILPMPPAPPARFHIAGEAVLTELEEARRLHPDDHLLLAILQARAGFDREARAELARVRKPSDVALAERLLREIGTWPP